MAYKPISNEYLQSGLQQYIQSQPAPVEEKPLWERAKDDIVNTVSNYFEGAVSGYQELERADANLKANSEQVESAYGSYSVPTTESAQYYDKASNAFAEETIKPVIGPIALATGAGALAAPATFGGAAALTGTAYLPFMASDAHKSYDNAANPHAGMGDLRQEERSPGEVPIGGVTEGLKTLGRDFTYGGIYDFVTNPDLAKNFHDKPISTIGEGTMQVLNAALLGVGAVHGIKKAGNIKNELVSHVESRLNEQLNEFTDNPPLKNTGIQGLDALDQLDAPNQGFRAATKDELKQTVIEQLEQIKAQKFDKANQESYFNNMRQQELESNALQAQKNEIAGSVLMSPLDRMEVGADLPIKRTLGGQGEVLGLKPIDSIRNEIFLGEKPVPQEIIKVEQPRYSRPQERPFLPSAEQLIDRNKQNQIQQELGISRNGITARNPIFGDRGNSFPPIVKAEQPVKFEQPHQEFVKIVEDKIKSQKEAVEEKPANILPIEEKQQLEKLLAELEGHKNAYIDEMVQYYEGNPGGKGVKQGGLSFDTQGNVVNRFGRESLNPQWYQEYYSEYGSKPSKARLREFAEKQLEGSREIPEGHADFIEIKSMIDNVKSILSGNGKLSAGFDPTFGKYDNLSIGDIGNKAFEKVAEKMWNSEETVKKIPAFSEHKQWFSGLNEKVKEKISASDGKSKGRALAREVFEPLVVDRFYNEGKIPAVGARYGDAPASGFSFNTATGLSEKGVSMMQVNDLPGVNSFAVASARDNRALKYYIGEAITHTGGDNEILMTNTKPITKKQYESFVNSVEGKMSSYAISFWKTDKMAQMGASRMYPEMYKRWDDIYNKKEEDLGNLIQPKTVKLQSGLDPTGGRFDNVDLGAKAKEYAIKIKDRIVSTSDDGRIIDNNTNKKLPPIKKVLQRAYQQVFDSLDPISRYDKEVYKSARLANGSAIGKAESMIKNQNNPNSFENIVKPVQNRIDDFAEYMVAKRAKELHATGTMTGVSNAKINEILSKAPAEFADVQKQLTSYSDKLVEMLVDSGMISEEHAINMFNKYESYAPMMQAFDGEQISRMFQDKGDLGKPIKNIEGSDSKVVNPIESILKNTYTFNMIAETNKVRQQIASLAESFPDEIKILKSGESAEKGTGTFDFFVNGKKQTMQLEPRLFEAIASMDSQQAGIVVSVLSKPASWLRAGATISPEFMAKNLIRDTIGAGIVGKDFTPFVDSIRGLKSAWKKDADYWRYKEEGGALGHLTGLDRDYMQEMVDNYRKKSNAQKLSAVFNPKTWLDVLRKGQELSEDATRIGYYKKRLSKGDSPHEAAFEARDLLDFGRSGNYTKEANKVVAFLNASLQGSDKLARSFKERPLETAANTMKYLILPSMAVWYMQEKSGQKEQIKELPRYVRDMFWVIPTGDTLIRIPKPFEPGMLFATGTERTMEAMFGDSKTPYKGYAESLMDVTLPNLLPTGLIPLGEWWANKSFFTGQAIVPNREQDLPEAMQYGPYTTNVAKTIGEKTGQSPRKIDNAIRGLTGGMGTTVISAIDSLTGGTGTVRPAKSLSDMPVVKAFIADPRKGQQSTQDFYDELDKYTKKHQAESIRNVKMTATEKQNYTALNNANTALKALNKEERKVLESNTLSPEAKKQKINKLIDAQSKLVQASLKRIK